jgi:hypothetical protein
MDWLFPGGGGETADEPNKVTIELQLKKVARSEQICPPLLVENVRV